MLPHERSLVKRLEGKPFVLLGVDVNDDRDFVKRQMARDIVTWRSWWDEEGTIAKRWGVRYFPGIFLIDAKGVLRKQYTKGAPSPDELDAAIDRLVAEAEKESS